MKKLLLSDSYRWYHRCRQGLTEKSKEKNAVVKYSNIEKSHRQKKIRKARNEHAFIFTNDLSECLAMVEREDWEDVVSFAGGSPADAADLLNIRGVPGDARVLWGRSEEEARAAYINWQKRRSRKKAH